jgi:hypothetical protein
VLITGTPGTGKRPLGGYLEARHGFVHLDLDSRETRTRFLRAGADDFRTAVAGIVSTSKKVVVTWTFRSETQLAYVESMRRLGFEWVWMDSDRGAAFDAFVTRDSPLTPSRFLDMFEPDGEFRPLESVTAELDRAPAPRPDAERRRRRLPVPSLAPLMRPAFAGVAGFAAAAAAAAGAYVLGAFDPAAPAHVAVARSHAAHVAQLPADAVFVPGKSLGGVKLGQTSAQVRALWGRKFTVCGSCRPTTWFFMSPTGDPFGAGVVFRGGRVTAVFTLGAARGWHTTGGVRVGQLLARWNDPPPSTTATACSGYGALSTRSADTVTSILTIGQSVYGFALTRPSEPICH